MSYSYDGNTWSKPETFFETYDRKKEDMVSPGTVSYTHLRLREKRGYIMDYKENDFAKNEGQAEKISARVAKGGRL